MVNNNLMALIGHGGCLRRFLEFAEWGLTRLIKEASEKPT
jgi:hypothetical protein